ncbi:hypothetical protein [Kitasatospora phosalacinea]|uniref:Uncharacterized protein n=1 Tax=Kitasatospora phosalacinea TaxID=2065 RepID=A0A9W6PGX4_9ACTN|nr:hypothetical protein [Kitasatospora phosalacinea]GLW54835.1 hypothetical protein Kpho01_28460 [Kitasatospora phosalacinea]
MILGGVGPRWGRERGRVRSQWPTGLPGVGFRVHGVIALRLPRGNRGERAAAAAAARLALERQGRTIAARHRPDELEVARLEVARQTVRWRALEEGGDGGHWKARLTLSLGKEDGARSQAYLDSLRAARLRAEQEQVGRDVFQEEVLATPDAARVWWLLTHTGAAPRPDWKEFREHILPLVGGGDDAQSRTDRFVHGFARFWDHLGADPGQRVRFMEVVDQVLARMGWPALENWGLPPEPGPEVDPGPEVEPEPEPGPGPGSARRARSGGKGAAG